MAKRKHCSAQPYLDYLGVSERERREWNKEEDFECFICDGKIENVPKNRVKVITGKTSYIPETWGICPDCSERKRVA